MQPSVYNYLKNHPEIANFVRKNPNWYRYLTRDPSQVDTLHKVAKEYDGNTIPKRIHSFTSNIQMMKMMFHLLSSMKD